jgi:ABC-type lipoprotein release transport system permease subunit
MFTLLKMAFRDLGRNRRRSFFSALALGIGLALLLLMAAIIRGELNATIQTSILLQSGDMQVRAASYNEDKTSLAWKDLIADPSALAAQIAAMAPVKVATPRLFASGIVEAGDTSLGVRIIGIDPASPANQPYQTGLVKGQFLTADDSSGIFIGQPLADKLGVETGSPINLSVNTSNGDVAQQSFTVRGLYNTHTPGYDDVTVLLPLAKAQTIAQAGNHASTIFVLLKDQSQVPAVAATIPTATLKVLTFDSMNALLVQLNDYSNAFMFLLYLIVLAITATVIVNTLIMAVFERTREIGILSAIGMKSGSIMFQFFAESGMLAAGGIVIGWILGALLIAYSIYVGFYFGDLGITGIAFGDSIHGQFALSDGITLTVMALVVTLLAALYPALLASRMEPVKALHSGN